MAVFLPTDNALDVREKVIANGGRGYDDFVAAEGKIAIEKLRLVGLYDDRQDGFFMLRVRIPGGRLNADQTEALGAVVEKHVRRPPNETGPENFAEITTRQDVQLHWIRIDEIASLWGTLERVGLNSFLACGDTVRNVTGCALGGLLPDEVMDASGIVDEVSRYFVTNPEAGVFLPRKFKVSISGSVEDCVVSRINDLAFTPARKDGRIGFNVAAGGGLSDYPRLASDLDAFVRPEEVVGLVDACVRLYKEIGDYQEKAVNRFRAVVAEHGPQEIRDRLVRHFGAALPAAGADLVRRPGDDHLGPRPQKQAGLSTFGLNVLVGRLSGPQLRELARLARTYGDGGVRLTQRQNAVLTGVPAARVEALAREALVAEANPIAGSPAGAVVACTSAPFCKFGIFDVKTRGSDLATRLSGTGGSPFLLHVSGCKASCAQPQVADIGLRATPAMNEEEAYVEAFDVCAGGNLFGGRLGHWIAYGVPVDEVYEGIRLLRQEYERNGDGETFGEFAGRRGWPLPSREIARLEDAQ